MNFYDNKQAAAAIAAEIHPSNTRLQRTVAEQYWYRLYDALVAGELVGRFTETRCRISIDRFGSRLMFTSCLICEADLNRWLESAGIGIQVDGLHLARSLAATVARTEGLPTTAKLAGDLGPFLSAGKDSVWLKRILGDLRNRPELKRYRTLTSKPRGALWRPGAVVLWLINREHMSNRSGRAALKHNYPDDYDMLED